MVNMYGATTTVSNLELNNDGMQAELVDNRSAGATELDVEGLFTSTKGALDFNSSDIRMSGGGTVFDYDGGVFTATVSNSITATNDANGEFVFDNGAADQTIAVGVVGLVFPAVRLTGDSAGDDVILAADPNNKAFTVSDRFVFEGASDLNFGTDELLTLGDGIWIKRDSEAGGAGVFDKAPKFGGASYNEYEGATAVATGNELNTTVNGLYIDMDAAGVNVNASKNVTVSNMLYLNQGTYDLENVANTIYTVTMGENSAVYVVDGIFDNVATAGNTTELLGGPVTLTYANTGAAQRTTTSHEFPGTDAFVTVLNVNSALGSGGLQLHADRSVGSLVLNTGQHTTAPVTTVEFDLNGNDLTVTDVATATLTRGRLDNDNGANASTLDVLGLLTVSSNASINDVNVTVGGNAELAGAFTGGETMTVQGDATFDTFTGNATIMGNSTLNGTFTGTLTAHGHVTIDGGDLAGGSDLIFAGPLTPQNLALDGDDTIFDLTINKDNGPDQVHLMGGSLNLDGLLTLENGLFVIDDPDNVLFLTNPAGAVAGQGFDRNVDAGEMSHVVGTVGQEIKNGTNTANGRTEYPVGTMTNYRRAAITIVDKDLAPGGVGVNLFVNHQEGVVDGAVGLPIPFSPEGSSEDLQYARYPDFFWNVRSNASLGQLPFDLQLDAGWI